MKSISFFEILQVPKMPQLVREGLFRVIRWAELESNMNDLERIENQRQGKFFVVSLPSTLE